MSFRDAHERDWQEGLGASSLIITDALTARRLPPDLPVRVFPIIADSSLEEVTRYRNFLTGEAG
jgi:hypothetical protein